MISATPHAFFALAAHHNRSTSTRHDAWRYAIRHHGGVRHRALDIHMLTVFHVTAASYPSTLARSCLGAW
jgi:hypothetical protein